MVNYYTFINVLVACEDEINRIFFFLDISKSRTVISQGTLWNSGKIQYIRYWEYSGRWNKF